MKLVVYRWNFLKREGVKQQFRFLTGGNASPGRRPVRESSGVRYVHGQSSEPARVIDDVLVSISKAGHVVNRDGDLLSVH